MTSETYWRLITEAYERMLRLPSPYAETYRAYLSAPVQGGLNYHYSTPCAPKAPLTTNK